MSTKILDVSSWNLQTWRVPAGSRDKSFVENPTDGNLYFFKLSKLGYPSEFWSEIIASQLGKRLGFELLEYNVGILNNKVGCICQSMLKNDFEELIHGINILSEMIEGFKISNKPKFSFQDIQKSFSADPKGSTYLTKMLEILVFDSIIGNTDRHLENWAIIRVNEEFQDYDHLPESLYRLRKSLRKFRFFLFKPKLFKRVNDPTIYYKFAPIYDSGSSLGREIAEEKLVDITSDNKNVIKYINNGKNEVRWNGEKMSFFNLVKVAKETFPEVSTIIDRVIESYDDETIKKMIYAIDDNLPDTYKEAKLSQDRKLFIYKLVSLRLEMLKSL